MRTGLQPISLLAFVRPMKPWPLVSLSLLAGLHAAPGKDIAALERQGKEALTSQLWEIAEMRFKECLRDGPADAATRSRIAIHLAESLIRSGNPSEALDLLGQSFVVKNPETPFWRAQALAGQGRFGEAVAEFSSQLENPASPHRSEAGLTCASLLLALGRSLEALETLAKLLPATDPMTEGKIRLTEVEIRLDLGQTIEARGSMPDRGALPVTLQPLADLLEARILLDEGHPADAESRFQDLLLRPQGLSRTSYHSAAIFLADSMRALGKSEAASRELLAFIDTHRTSPLLEAMFRRIVQWLPEKLEATDPVLDRIATWIAEPSESATPPPYAATATHGGEPTYTWPQEPEVVAASELSLFALYTRAIGLRRVGTPEARALANRLFNRLRVGNPGHFLATRSLFQQARWRLDEGSVEAAFELLDTVRESAKFPELKGHAAFLEARTAYLKGDPDQAVRLFEEAAKSLEGEDARLATLQASIARLRLGDGSGVSLIQQDGGPADPSLEADLQLERALSATAPATRRSLIDEFLTRFPTHPRTAEARLAGAEAALSGPDPDLSYARAQLDTMDAMPENSPAPAASRIAMARLRIMDLAEDSSTSSVAQAIVDQYPGTLQATEAAFTLGRRLFQEGNYNRAGMVLVELAKNHPDAPQAEAAWLIAARAAALGGTPQSKEQALELFDKAIAAKGPLEPLAALEKSRHLIDLFRYPEATAFLERWLKKLPADDPLRLPVGLLLGEALFARGSGNPESLVKALAVYDQLLDLTKNHPALLDRLQFCRGKTLELLPDPKDPTKMREKEAFQAYHSVLEGDQPPAEWEYFELCGFKALALLEKAERWQAAITVAKKIASFNGPQAAEANARAVKLQLDHMIWED